MMKIKRCKLLLLFLLLRVCVMAQTEGYHYQAKLDSIHESGFYNILLTPIINAHLKIDCSDFRIINDSGKWVPHLLRNPNGRFETQTIERSFNIIKKESSNSNTELVVETIDSITSNLILEIKNTLAERYCSVTGSDDQLNWFVINDSIVIRPEKINGDENSYFKISFPSVNYKYLRVNINNHGKDPFNIVTVRNDISTPYSSVFKGLEFHKHYENPIPIILQKDSAGKSFVKIVLPASYHFDNISLKLSGSKYYERLVNIYKPISTEHSFSNPGQWVDSFTISNNSTLAFDILNPLKAKEFYLIINNDDNLPLKIEDVKTYMSYRVATAWLEKGNLYSIVLDNPLATQPIYDLKEKNIDPGKEFPIIKINDILSRDHTTTTAQLSKNKTMIWLLIAIAISVLGFFTYKLITDMNKSKS